MLADRIRDRALAPHDFIPHLRAAAENQLGMGKCVIPNHMSRLSQFAHDVGPLLDKSPNQEKRRPRAVLGQNLEQAESVRIIRAIIIGKRQVL